MPSNLMQNIQLPYQTVTEGTVPASPAAGDQRLYIDSVDHRLKRVNSAGAIVAIDSPELDYVQATTNTSITATTEGTANTVLIGNSISLNGTTIIMIEFWAYGVTKGTTSISIVLFEDSTALGQANIVASNSAPVNVKIRRTPSNASHVYYVKAFVDAGTGTVSAGAGGTGAFMPCYLRVYRA